MTDMKADLHRYLRDARGAVLWKIDGLAERDVRRPLTPTGTNLLGLLKHLTVVELLYLGFLFGRHIADPPAWFAQGLPPNTDMWATESETREYIVDTHRRACAHADATIDALALDTPCHVVWWSPEYADATLHRVLVHLIAEQHRHAGHADIVRELIDGAAGLQPGNDFLPPVEESWWPEYRARLARVAGEWAR